MSARAISEYGFSLLQQIPCRLNQAYETLQILFWDIIPSTFTGVIPNAVSWGYRTWCTGSIRRCEAFDTTSKVADLFIHGNVPFRSDGCISAVLLLHGEHSHALTMQHLGDIAEAEGRAVFSVNLPYDDLNPENHLSLLRQSIDRVERMIHKSGGRLSHLALAGHSRGAIEAAYVGCVEHHPKVNAVIGIAGRFKVVEPSHRPCRETLKPTVRAVWDKVRPFQPLGTQFCQIAANQDWCIDPEASIVRGDLAYRFVDASHLGVLYHPDTLESFKSWMSIYTETT